MVVTLCLTLLCRCFAQGLNFACRGLPHAQRADLNRHVAAAMAGSTRSQRFRSPRHNTLRKWAQFLTPFEGARFLMMAQTSGGPPQATEVKANERWHLGMAAESRGYEVVQMARTAREGRNVMCRADVRHGRFLVQDISFLCGADTEREIAEIMMSVAMFNSSNWVEWLPNNIKWWRCDLGRPEAAWRHRSQATLAANSTAMQHVLRQLVQAADPLLRRRAHLHWYTAHGLEEAQLDEARQVALDVADLYATLEEASADDMGYC